MTKQKTSENTYQLEASLVGNDENNGKGLDEGIYNINFIVQDEQGYETEYPNRGDTTFSITISKQVGRDYRNFFLSRFQPLFNLMNRIPLVAKLLAFIGCKNVISVQ